MNFSLLAVSRSPPPRLPVKNSCFFLWFQPVCRSRAACRDPFAVLLLAWIAAPRNLRASTSATC
jgi:hypothetical protein